MVEVITSLAEAPSTWHLQMDGKRDGLSDARRQERLRNHSDTGDLSPSGEGPGAAEPEVCGGAVVAAAGKTLATWSWAERKR
jgi:hypothetical protein